MEINTLFSEIKGEQTPWGPQYYIYYALMYLADDTFARLSQRGGGKCPNVPLKQRGVFPCPFPIENVFSYVPCSPILSLLFCFHQKLALLSPFT